MRPSSILIAMLAAMVVASHSATAADVPPPRLESWEVYPAAINVSDSSAEVYVEFRVTDDQSQIQTPSVRANSLTTSQSTGFGDVTVISSSNDGLMLPTARFSLFGQGLHRDPGRPRCSQYLTN